MSKSLKVITTALTTTLLVSLIGFVGVCAAPVSESTTVTVPEGTPITLPEDTEVTITTSTKRKNLPIILGTIAVVAAGAVFYIKRKDSRVVSVKSKKPNSPNKIKYSEKDRQAVLLIKELADIFQKVDKSYKS